MAAFCGGAFGEPPPNKPQQPAIAPERPLAPVRHRRWPCMECIHGSEGMQSFRQRPMSGSGARVEGPTLRLPLPRIAGQAQKDRPGALDHGPRRPLAHVAAAIDGSSRNSHGRRRPRRASNAANKPRGGPGACWCPRGTDQASPSRSSTRARVGMADAPPRPRWRRWQRRGGSARSSSGSQAEVRARSCWSGPPRSLPASPRRRARSDGQPPPQGRRGGLGRADHGLWRLCQGPSGPVVVARLPTSPHAPA